MRTCAGSTALHRATEEHVRRKRAQPSGDAAAAGDAALAQLEDWLQCVRLLLAHPRADVAATDDAGDTVLHIAAAADAVDVCREVAAVDASVVDMADRQGRSALMVAIARQAHRAVEFLIREANADLDHVDHKGWAPLHFAASGGDVAAVSALLEANPGLNVNRQDARQLTAAHAAVHKGHVDTLRALLSAPQFDVLAGRDGLSLAHCACSSSASDSAQILDLLLAAQDGRLRERVYMPREEWTHGEEDDGVCRFQVRVQEPVSCCAGAAWLRGCVVVVHDRACRCAGGGAVAAHGGAGGAAAVDGHRPPEGATAGGGRHGPAAAAGDPGGDGGDCPTPCGPLPPLACRRGHARRDAMGRRRSSRARDGAGPPGQQRAARVRRGG